MSSASESLNKSVKANSDNYADMVYARIGEKIEDTQRIAIDVLGDRISDKNFTVTMPKSEMSKVGVEPGDRVLLHVTEYGGGLSNYTGKVLQKLDEGEPATLTGVYSNNGEGRLFIPDNKAIKTKLKVDICDIRKAGIEHRQNCYCLLPVNFDYKNSFVVIPPNQDEDQTTKVKIPDILRRIHGVKNGHPQRVLDEAPYLLKNPVLLSGRHDLTNLDFITVDPADARDFDDAFYGMPVSGGFRLIVAIADVAHYVKSGSLVDQEAMKRGNTVYFPDKPAFMLPSDIIKQCSLSSGQVKPAQIFDMFFDASGRRQHCDIYLGIIKSRAQLYYGQYDKMIENGHSLVSGVHGVMDALKQGNSRIEMVQGTTLLREDPALYIGGTDVETAMVNANAWSGTLLNQDNIPTLYRNNGATLNIDLYAKTRERIVQLGINMVADPRKCSMDHLNAIKNEAIQRGVSSYVAPLLHGSIIDRATYGVESMGHMGLREPFYTHATSPLRRAADIIVSRSLRTRMGVSGGLTDNEIEGLEQRANHLSIQNRKERDIRSGYKRFHAYADLERLTGHEVKAMVLDIEFLGGAGEETVEILFPDKGIRTRMHASDLVRQGAHIDRERALIVLDDGNTIAQGDRILTRIDNVVPQNQLIDMRIRCSGNAMCKKNTLSLG